MFVRPHSSVDLLLVEPTSSSSIAANEKEVEEPKEKEMEGEKTEKEKSMKERIEKGKKHSHRTACRSTVCDVPSSDEYHEG